MAGISDTATVTSGTTSIISLIISGITQSNIAWTIGVLAGCAAIFSAYLGWLKHRRDKNESAINIKTLQAEMEYYKKLLKTIDENKKNA